jgi:uncharacterized membrane protein
MSPNTAPPELPAAGPAPGTPGNEAAPGWQLAAAAAALAAYALLSHWLMLHAAQKPWAVAVLFGPLVAAVAAAGWQRRQPLLLAACGAGVAVLALVVARGGVDDVNRMYVLQHAGIHAALACAFGFTLRRGGTPLITALARSVHLRLGHGFSAELVAYTRWVTGLWTAYFGAMVLLSLAIYLLAPWPWWSAFGNLFTPLSAAALMIGEHIQRYRRHPHFDRVSLRAAIAAYSRSGKT